jgi:hypothetical protein
MVEAIKLSDRVAFMNLGRIIAQRMNEFVTVDALKVLRAAGRPG